MRGSTEALENKVRTYLKNEIAFPPKYVARFKNLQTDP